MKTSFALSIVLLAVTGCSPDAPSNVEVAEQAAQVEAAAVESSQPAAEASTASVPDLPVAEGQSSLRLAIEGMHCDGCAAGVAKRLKAVDGVVDCTVSFEADQAVVVYDPSTTDAAALAAAAIGDTGYAVSPLP